MTALEMFDMVGYKMVGNVGGITFSKSDKILGNHIIKFDNRFKLISMYWEVNGVIGKVLPSETLVNSSIILAVTQQMKEFGWIK